jgi:hypothetical protein
LATFIQNNADSGWNTAKDATSNQLGSAWDGPFDGPGNAMAESAGLDALVAAAATLDDNGDDYVSNALIFCWRNSAARSRQGMLI